MTIKHNFIVIDRKRKDCRCGWKSGVAHFGTSSTHMAENDAAPAWMAREWATPIASGVDANHQQIKDHTLSKLLQLHTILFPDLIYENVFFNFLYHSHHFSVLEFN